MSRESLILGRMPFRQYQVGLGPFFHYFAHLQPRSRKAHRGQEKMLHAVSRT